MLAIGLPIVIRSSSPVISATVDQIVVSASALSRSTANHTERVIAVANSSGQRFAAAEYLQILLAPPACFQQTARSRELPASPLRSSFSSSLASRCPSVRVASLHEDNFAPESKGNHSSSPAMSKESVVTAARVSASVSPGFAFMLHSRLSRARCETATPFGLPVEPEVYSR